MEFGDIEVLAETKFNEHVLVKVKGVKAGLHGIKCFRGVQLELGVIDEVCQSTDDCKNSIINVWSPSEQSNKDPLHLLVLSTCPLRYKGNAFSEVP